MMNFDLNGGELANLGASKVFNQGIAGKVTDCTISIKRREESGPYSYADYSLVVNKDGSTLNQFFNHFKNNDQYDADKNAANQKYLLSRILSIAHAVVPAGFVFPDVSGKTVQEITDILFRIIHENCEGKRVNVFAAYGTKAKPSQFLNLRFFQFIEPVGTEKSRLVATGNDMMERLAADAPLSGDAVTPPTASGW